MEKAQKLRVNRCFGDSCHQNPKEQREQKIKEVLSDASQRRRANKEISQLLKMFHGRRKLRELLWAMKQRGYPDYVLTVAIERVEAERKRNELTVEEVVDFEEFKTSLEKPE